MRREEKGGAGSRQKGGKARASDDDSDEGNPGNKNSSRNGSGGRGGKNAAPTMEQMAARLEVLTRMLEEKPDRRAGGRARKLSWSGGDSLSDSEDENRFDRDGRAGRKRGGQRNRDRSGGSKKRKKSELSPQTRQDLV